MRNLLVLAIAAIFTVSLYSCQKKSNYTCHCLVITPGTTDTSINYTAEYEGVTKKTAEQKCKEDKEDYESVWLGVTCEMH